MFSVSGGEIIYNIRSGDTGGNWSGRRDIFGLAATGPKRMESWCTYLYSKFCNEAMITPEA